MPRHNILIFPFVFGCFICSFLYFEIKTQMLYYDRNIADSSFRKLHGLKFYIFIEGCSL